jgi:hypothetical protein
MPRLEGVEGAKAGLFARVVYWMTKRRFGHVLEGVKIAAHSPRLLQAVGRMEMALPKINSVDPVLVSLAEINVATLIGCPF